MSEHDDFEDFHDLLADLPPELLADYLTQLQANLDRAESRSDRLRRRVDKLEADRETLRIRLDEARTAAKRRGLGRFKSMPPPELTASRQAVSPTGSRHVAKGQLELTVATILDPISTAVFEPEFDSIPLGRNSWREQLTTHEPEMLLVESAFSGSRGDWAFRVAHFGAPHPDLASLVATAKEMGIPTVFWNKEDPINYGMFLGTASLFDHVFTVDASVIGRYQSDLGHERVHLLPFAAQPALHFPPDPNTTRRGTIAFAGSYYAHKHPARRIQMEYLLDASLEFDLDIYDRMDRTDDPRFRWPDRFASRVVGSVPYLDIADVYRDYKVFLNVNTVTDSPTMCARRVFELAACGTPTVTGPSTAIELLVPDGIAYVANNRDETSRRIGTILEDTGIQADAAIVGPEWIQQGNTYEDRVATILNTLQ